jgi:ABC-type transport system involved in cytochrome bd biosynthesis fused ATPase/permease subunit
VKSSDLRLLLSRGGSRRVLFVAIAAALLWSAAIVVSALILSSLITDIINGERSVPTLLIYLACAWGFRAIFQSTFEFWSSRQAVRIKQELRSEVTGSLDVYSNIPASHMSVLLVKGLNSLDIYLGRFVPQMFFASITPVIVISTILILDPLSGLIAIVTLPLIPIFGALIGKYTADSVAKKWQTLGSLSKYFEDSLRGFVTLKIFGRHSSQSVRIKEMGDRYTEETMKVLRISFLSALALELCATISVALIAVSIGIRLVDDQISFGHALAVLILAPEVYFPLRNAASLFHASVDGTQALAELSAIRNMAEKKVDQVQHDFSSLSELAWEKWSLNVPRRINSTIDAGQLKGGDIHFIVGESGIGKTSFAMNLLGVGKTAKVYADAIELSPAYQESWFKVIGWIPQNPALASGTVRKQFTLVDSSLRDEVITTLLKKCGLPLSDLPQGLDTPLANASEGGSAASGGQIRKIAIARALAAKPRVIIADEPTADLDQESSNQVLATLREYAANGAIVICVSHDLSLLEKGDSTSTFVRGALS